MKKLTVILAAFAMLCIVATSNAQTPQAIKYQALARNSNGDIIANQQVSFRISILQGSEQGNTVYEEIQPATTNQFGLANLSIGTGNVVSGIFDSIKWGNATYFAKIEFDPKGGSDFAVMGTSQLLSVPYSLYAEHARMADNMPVFPIKAALQATNLQAPFDAPETGMLVYNTTASGTGTYSVVPGYYYNAGTTTDPNWVLLNGESSKSRLLPPNGGVDNTTYGGSVQDAVVGSATSAPTGNNNTAFGSNTFGGNASTNPSSPYNTAIGSDALFSITTGEANTGVGEAALYSNTSASGSTAMGLNSLRDNTVDANTAYGDSSAASNSTGTANTAIGYQALALNTTSVDNTAVGYAALKNSTGNNNTATGTVALTATTSGIENTATGSYAGYGNTTGGYNTVTGSGAFYDNTTGSYNTCMGYHALFSNTTGSENIAIGYGTDVSSGTLTNATVIGYNASIGASNTIQLGNTSLVNVNIAGALSVPTQSSSATTGTITVTQGIQVLALTGGGGHTGITIDFPSSPVNGQIFCIVGNTTFSAPTFSSTGNTFANVPTAITAGTALRFILVGTVWYNL
jgi:hypothetical protein